MESIEATIRWVPADSSSQMNVSRLSALRTAAPLVHNITNYVVMNNTANALLALGASPVMAHAADEVEEMVGLADALVLNIGTLSSPWLDAMAMAARAASARHIPIVLDPVGCGATAFRTQAALGLIQAARPGLIRGNASEIRALAKCTGGSHGTKGVDSRHAPDEVIEEALALARTLGCTVAVSGAVDLVVDDSRVARVHNGHPLMARVTGMGCTASALSGAFLAVEPDTFEAATLAMVTMGVAGELAAAGAAGPGSFQMRFLDTLYGLCEADLQQRARMTRT